MDAKLMTDRFILTKKRTLMTSKNAFNAVLDTMVTVLADTESRQKQYMWE